MIVIGTSLGGIKAVQKIFSKLPDDFSLPIALVMHRHKEADDYLVEFIQKDCTLPVTQVVDKDPILPGKVFLAPADYHLLVEDSHFSLSVDDLVQFARPSIDVLFESAADVFGEKAIAVILTGANQDGANGAKQIKAQGGIVIVENPRNATCANMPTAAIEAASPQYICSLEEIAPLLVQLASAERRKS